jgi:hypothetical protein
MRWRTIPTPDEWKKATSSAKKFILGRGGLVAIDEAIATFTRVSQPNAPLAPESEALIELFEAIEEYQARAPATERESAAVQDLRAIALFTLSDMRWQKLREVTGGGRPGLKPMVPHVWSEMHSPGHARVGHDENSNQLPDPWLRGDDSAPEKYLFQYLRRVRQELKGAEDGVRYLEDEERWEFQVVFEQHLARRRFLESKGRIHKLGTAPITTEGGDLGTSIYAMDGENLFYVETQNTGQTLNHCSFLAGRPVKCAGMIGITQGRIGYIDNGSGHYRPTRKHLVNCLEVLRDHVGDTIFNQVIVRDHSGRYPKAAYSAPRFLATGGACLPIGHYPSAAGRYDTQLQRFGTDDEKRTFFADEEQGLERKAFEKKIGELLKRIELSGRKGTLINDDERNIIKRVLTDNLRPFTVVSPYFKQDPPMLAWVQQHGYHA